MGQIYGRCKPGDPAGTIEFVNDATATDGVTYRVARTPARTINVDPGNALRLTLVPGRFTSHEPSDPVSHFSAIAIRTTEPVSLGIEQGTEPHIFRIRLRFAVAAAVGDTADCALIPGSMDATTYYPGGQPPS